MLTRITVEQLNAQGEVSREFTFHKHEHEIEGCLHRITFAYYLPRTRVSVGGEPVQLERPNGDRSVTTTASEMTVERYWAKDAPGAPTGFAGCGWAVKDTSGKVISRHAFRVEALAAAGLPTERS